VIPPAEFAAFFRKQMAKWAKVIKDAGIEPKLSREIVAITTVS